MRTSLGCGAAALALVLLPLGMSNPAEAATPKTYKNCTALNKAYPHGVGKAGARDKVARGAKPVTNFTRSNKTYSLNKGRDRDKDGIACEKR